VGSIPTIGSSYSFNLINNFIAHILKIITDGKRNL